MLGDGSIGKIIGLGIYESGSTDDASRLEDGDSFCPVEVEDAAWINDVAGDERESGGVRDALSRSQGEFATGCDGDISVCRY